MPNLLEMPRVMLVVVLLLAGSPVSAPAQEHSVAHVHTLDTLPMPSFTPAEVTIKAGDAVEWDNHALRIHSVTHARCPRIDQRQSPEGCKFDTERDRGADLNTGDTFRVSFETTGIFPYLCAIHRFGGTITVLGEGSPLPDLTIESLEVHATPFGTSRRVEALVANLGEGVAQASRVHFLYRPLGSASWTLFGDAEIGPLGPGERLAVNQDWSVLTKVGDYEVRAVADGASTVAESDEQNNSSERAVAVLLPAGTVPGAPLPDLPKPSPITTQLPTLPKP